MYLFLYSYPDLDLDLDLDLSIYLSIYIYIYNSYKTIMIGTPVFTTRPPAVPDVLVSGRIVEPSIR